MVRSTILAGVLAAAALASNASAQETLRIGGVIFGEHSSVRAIREVFIPEVEKATQGRYRAQLFFNGELGGNAEIVQQARNGTIFAALVSSAWVTSYVPELGVTGLPFLFSDRPTIARVLGGPLGAELTKAMDTRGFTNLGFMELGFRHLTNSKKPVATPEDIKGLKIRLQSNPVHIETFRTLGANTAQVDGKELFSALRQGVVDGQENPYSVISMFKIPDTGQKHLTETAHFYDMLLFAASKKMLDAIPAADRQAILDIARRTTQKQLEYALEEEAKFKADVLSKGVQIVSLTTAQRDAFRKATQPVYEQTRKTLDAGLVDRFVAATQK